MVCSFLRFGWRRTEGIIGLFFLDGLAIDSDKVVADDENHGQAAETVGECGELVVVHHLGAWRMREDAD